ncbi:MAG: hypothetical protein ACK4ND_12970 [Cytophagaceae bacterium]
MKKIIFTVLISLLLCGSNTFAQDRAPSEKYGNTLNLGLGIGHRYVGHSTPVFHLNYEIDVAKNFTLAPFITYYSYRNNHYYGGPNSPYKHYGYRQSVIPIGLKGTYYFDQLLNAPSNWDFYAAGSLGFAIRSTRWDDNYYGHDLNRGHGAGMLYLDIHIGAEYHLNNKFGIFLDLSSGISTIGLAVHL